MCRREGQRPMGQLKEKGKEEERENTKNERCREEKNRCGSITQTERGKRESIIIIYVTTMEPPHPYGPKLQSKKKWPHDKTHLFLMMMSGKQSWNPNIVIKMEGFYNNNNNNNNNNIDFF